MKIFILLAALCSSSAFAQMIFPDVYNMGRSVQVRIHNNTIFAFNCSGPVYITTPNGFESQYYFGYLNANMFESRILYPRAMNVQIQNVSHGIFCNRVN